MSSRYYELQNEAANSRTSSPHRPSNRTSTSSESSSSSSSSSSGSSSYSSSYTDSAAARYSMDASQPRVEVMRCSRCAKCVETVISARAGGDVRRVSTDDAQASGMVRFGHNLYYCDRCARMVGYK
ncbi:hypothetical protein ONS95_006583 [Cadophora gregata]|uniref:uncharacterized protein n=1 Tax=Cadophora gregata TaxID=51156 RepID=UPI0026DD6FEB|nr:uncharacterized protein ONS95_006583 [Cadophora gregata]KAK0101410.1 hypothetical protein ONS95_006583 [Cadophora gregata]KAK0106579.1 hypothetical protein ONS96_004200 [Cadophora gregata f. sp. sojae]